MKPFANTATQLLEVFAVALLAGITVGHAEVKPGTFDLDAIHDPATLETRVIQDWKPAPKDPSIRQKVIEITVCEWWPGQKVRLPVTLNAPASGAPCRNVMVGNMGLAPKAALPAGAMLRLLKEKGVGVVLIGMSTVDAMEPVGKLHLGMKDQLLKTRDARFTPAWIWGMSDMRALTAAVAEADVFRPMKVLATGGSKRGVATAAAGIHDDRFTAILPVVAPPLGNPGGPYVAGTESAEVARANAEFLANLAAGKIANLPATAAAALIDRQERRGNERITLQQARDAGWTDAEVAAINDRAWDASRITSHLPALQKRGLEIFYNVGADDNVSPALLELGRRFPAFPIYIVPGGQHGGPKNAGFTRQVPSQPEVEDNLYAFAQHHFFGARPLIAAPKIQHHWDKATRRLSVTVTFPDGTEPQKNELWWSMNRHQPCTLAFEYDAWQSAPLHKTGAATFAGEISLQGNARTLDFVTTHTHVTNDLALTISSPMQRMEPK
ncbi:MAG TPA: hypothetical protein VI454_07720 [Verrucomicrobiae bacterium]|jgi:hypothetical protein